MSDFKNKLSEYICETFKLEDEILRNVLKQQKESGGPMMNIGADQGKFVSLIVKMTKSRKILEIGSYFGYSSIWFARALQALHKIEKKDITNYQITCIEKSSKQVPIIESNLKEAKLEEFSRIINADAKDFMNKLIEQKEKFDLIFIDADKGNYPVYLKQAEKLLNSGAILLVDNVLGLHSYEVVDEENIDSRILAIREFNSMLACSEAFDGSIVTIQAGLAVAIKN